MATKSAKKKVEPTQTREEAPAETPAAAAPEITFNDIQSIEKIINIATSRGAFRANELTQVGVVYDRLTVFLAWWAAKIEADKKEAEPKQEKK